MSSRLASTREESKWSKCIKAPFRVLSRAKVLYVRCVSDCAGQVSSYGAYGSGVGSYPAPHLTNFPRSFSSASASSDDDFRELIRAASTRSLAGKKKESDQLLSNCKSELVKKVPRSQSVAIGRIDEEAPCEFGQDVKMKLDWYPRSRSYAVTKTRVSNSSAIIN